MYMNCRDEKVMREREEMEDLRGGSDDGGTRRRDEVRGSEEGKSINVAGAAWTMGGYARDE